MYEKLNLTEALFSSKNTFQVGNSIIDQNGLSASGIPQDGNGEFLIIFAMRHDP